MTSRLPQPSAPEEKVLRIGLLQGGKIIEERLFRRREVITLGQAPTNTFYLPSPNLPTTLTLFDVRGGRYSLVLSAELSGRLTVDEVVRSLDEVAHAPESVMTAGKRSLPLDERARGRLELGELSIIFQFVVPPPIAPRPQLPASIRGGLGHALVGESTFLLCVVVSLLLQGGFVALSMRYETPPERRVVVNRYVQQLKVDVEIVTRKKRQSDLAEKAAAGAIAASEPAPGRRVRGGGSAPAGNGPAGRASASLRPPPMPGMAGRSTLGGSARGGGAALGALAPGSGRSSFARGGPGWSGRHGLAMRKTFLKAIVFDAPAEAGGGVGGLGIAGGGVANTLARGHVEQIARAFDPPTAVTVARPDDGSGVAGGGVSWLEVVGSRAGSEGQGGGSPLDAAPAGLTPSGPLPMSADERVSAGGASALRPEAIEAAPAKQPEETTLPHGSITLAGGADRGGGSGRLDASAVTSVFKKHAGAFRACYEGRLRVKPTLEGKIVIRFTIGVGGRATKVAVAENATADSALGACVVEKVRNMRFAKPEDGEVTFTYPIVLSRGS